MGRPKKGEDRKFFGVRLSGDVTEKFKAEASELNMSYTDLMEMALAERYEIPFSPARPREVAGQEVLVEEGALPMQRAS